MGLYEVLKKFADELDPSRFVTRHRGFYLLGYFRELDSSLLGFNTGKVPAMPDLEASGATTLRPKLWRLEKSERNTWRHVSVGRAKNNDVVIRERAISKVHAHFSLAEAPATSVQIVDIGSENGTALNGERLVTDEPREVRSGDEIIFGGTAVKLLDETALYRLLT